LDGHDLVQIAQKGSLDRGLISNREKDGDSRTGEYVVDDLECGAFA
jgi:hypothetical protein